MTGFARLVAERLTAGPIARWGAVGVSLSAGALAATWPTGTDDANASWVTVATVRAVATAGLALGRGIALPGMAPRDAAATGVAVVLAGFVGLPIERIAHAGVAGPLPAWWPWAWTVAVTVGHLAVGATLAALLRAVRGRALAPLAAGVYLVAVVAASARWGIGWLDPCAAALGAAGPLWAWTIAAAITAGGWAWRRRHR